MDILDQEITGQPAKFAIAGTEYPLAFPTFAVILYKQETAKLDRSRAAARSKLSPEEVRELKARRRHILAKSEDRSDLVAWSAAMEEGFELKRRIDEESCTGDSLFQVDNWWKIGEDDPERMLLALWSALHQQQPDDTWKAPFTRAQLERLVDFSNCRDLLMAIHQALALYMPRREKKDASPNASGPESANLPAVESETILETTKA